MVSVGHFPSLSRQPPGNRGWYIMIQEDEFRRRLAVACDWLDAVPDFLWFKPSPLPIEAPQALALEIANAIVAADSRAFGRLYAVHRAKLPEGVCQASTRT